MIIGTIALISMLFFGGIEYFLMDELEKGVKTFVVEKDRRKEIQADLKHSISIIKAFNKDRSSKLKVLKEMNADRNITKVELEEFYQDRHEERTELQRMVINERLKVLPKLTEQEWDSIVKMSAETLAKKKEKAAKKKPKDVFAAVIKTANKAIEEKDSASKVVELVNDYQVEFDSYVENLSKAKASNGEILTNKDASFEELKTLADGGNSHRKEAFNAFIHFHFELKEITNETEWAKIMKEFNKVIN
jgi:hypothetical protein